MALLTHVGATALAAQGERPAALRVREKFASLRVSWEAELRADGGKVAERSAMLSVAAERASMTICGQCGMPGHVHKDARGWYATRCEVCAAPDMLPVEGGRRSAFDAGGHLARGKAFRGRICRMHSGWLRDETEDAYIPYAHRPVVVAALALCAELISDADHAPAWRHGLRRLEMRDGRPYVELSLDRRRRAMGEALVAAVADAVNEIAPVGRGPEADEVAEAADDPEATGDLAPGRRDVGSDVSGRHPIARPGPGPFPELPGASDRLALYTLDDVVAALGESVAGADEEGSSTTEHHGRLRRILTKGEEGRWRSLARPSASVIDAIGRLGARAPHMVELTELVSLHARSAAHVGLPTALPPILLLGPPGVGKTWYLSRLAESLGVPFRTHLMNGSSLSDGLFGSAPSFRNAAPGLVASTLMREDVANPVIFVDEFDKAASSSVNADPFRPYYTALEPTGAQRFVDEYYGFPIDASHVTWIMSANAVDGIPAPILDRVTVLNVPDMDAAARAAVANSVYAQQNAVRRCFFTTELAPDVLALLVRLNARSMRLAVDRAMVRASAEGRREIRSSDLPPPRRCARRRIGFT